MTYPLSKIAREGILKAKEEHQNDKDKNNPKPDPNSNDSYANRLSETIAMNFLKEAFPDVDSEKFKEVFKDMDRLVKIGRNIVDQVRIGDEEGEDLLEKGLVLVLETCQALVTGIGKVPKVRFGRTNLQMPIISLGTMRFQETWNCDKIKNPDDADPVCQQNIYDTMLYAIKTLGITHLECANMYGSSEIQMGKVLKQLFESGEVKREDLIIQTKVRGDFDKVVFRKTLEDSFERLQLDYIDLFSFHGVAYDHVYDNVLNNGEDSLMNIIQEYKQEGKIRHVGFSTHGRASSTKKFIMSDMFDYANVHYHAIGSYTATGEDQRGCIKLMKEKDMGVFIISPNDKGGKLFAPSKKLRSLTFPDMEPLAYGIMWLWYHKDFDEENAPCHTYSLGAARPSDLDDAAIAAHLFTTKHEEMKEKILAINERMKNAIIDEFGEEWYNTWNQGLMNSERLDRDPYQAAQVVGLYNQIKGWGMLSFCRDRVDNLDSNYDNWDFSLSAEENIKNFPGWIFMPGITMTPNADYSDILKDVPEQNKERVLEAITFVYKYCSKLSGDKSELDVRSDWETAYDMRPWTAFPDRG